MGRRVVDGTAPGAISPPLTSPSAKGGIGAFHAKPVGVGVVGMGYSKGYESGGGLRSDTAIYMSVRGCVCVCVRGNETRRQASAAE